MIGPAPALPLPIAPTVVIDVSIVLPCLNEEDSVGLCVREALDACADGGLVGEVVVVDNNCTDRSAAVAREAGARVIEEVTPGYGAAIRAGIAAAHGTVVVMADADCTYPLDRLSELVHPVLQGTVDMMVGSRLEAATARSMPLLHRFVGTPTLTYLVRQGAGAEVLSDSQSGFRAFRRDTIGSLGLRSTGMEFASEMLIRATQRELRVREIPLGYRERVGESKLNTWSDGMRHLRLILRLSPHLLLWHPGIALIAVALGIFGVCLVDPAGVSVGSGTWQPIFFSGTLLLVGEAAMLSGAVLGHHLPTASPRVKRWFSWIADPSFTIAAKRTGLGLVLLGIGLDLVLFLNWRDGGTMPAYQRITLAGLAQDLILFGTVLGMFAVLYRLLTQAGQVMVPAPRRPQ